jgi:hypothetical protein
MENTDKVKKGNNYKKAGSTNQALMLFAVVSLLGILYGGCTSGVGDPCEPEVIPATKDSKGVNVKGFVKGEYYIEAGSVQCQTRVCGVFNLQGDPSDKCIGTPENPCPSRAEVDAKVYCTCRCKAPDSRFATCTCPSGFQCEEILTKGEVGVRGNYCVKAGTFGNVAR